MWSWAGVEVQEGSKGCKVNENRFESNHLVGMNIKYIRTKSKNNAFLCMMGIHETPRVSANAIRVKYR